MNINGRHLVRHMLLLLAGSGERASSYLKQARRLSSLPPGTQRRPIIRSIRTLRIRQTYGLDFSTAASISPLQAATMLTRRGIFINFRGPSALNGRPENAPSGSNSGLRIGQFDAVSKLSKLADHSGRSVLLRP